MLASVALVFSCLGFSCLRLLWSPLVVSPVVLPVLVLVPACSLWGLLGSLFGASGGRFWGLREPSGGLLGPILLPLCPSNAGSAGARASAYNPPTTACGATSVFETPSALRESSPSYSAKPEAFYAPRALRWTTPPRGRTDPFQGPKIKPIVHRCSMLFQDDFGFEMEAKMKSKSCQNRAWAPSKTLLEPGCRWKSFWPPFLTYFCTPRTTKNRALAVERCHFLEKWPVAPGGPKSTPKSPRKSRPKASPMVADGV